MNIILRVLSVTVWGSWSLVLCNVCSTAAHWNLGADPGYGQGGGQLLGPNVADIVEQSRANKVSSLHPGSRAGLRALEAFRFLMLKYAFSRILEILFLSFLISTSTIKADKNRTLAFTSINLRYFYILYPFFNLHEKVIPLIIQL